MIDAKRKLLSSQHAALGHRPGRTRRQVRHPLEAASWTPVVADLAEGSWKHALLKAGFSPGQPTVWVAEGIIMCTIPFLVWEGLRGMRQASVGVLLIFLAALGRMPPDRLSLSSFMRASGCRSRWRHRQGTFADGLRWDVCGAIF